MSRSFLPCVLALALCPPASASDGKIRWEKADAALASASATGKPVLWYFPMDQFDKAALPPNVQAIAQADLAFINPVIVKRQESFLWVRGDQAGANRFKVRGAPMVLFTDGDGAVLHRASIVSPETLFDAMTVVLKEKFVNVPVSWGDVVRTGPITKRLLVVGFEGEKGGGLKVLEDRTLVKYHANCEFVKLPFSKDGEDARRWGVTQAPTILVCDPMERVLEKVSGDKSPAEVKAALVRALRKVDGPARSNRR
jgi:hypothetical protein